MEFNSKLMFVGHDCWKIGILHTWQFEYDCEYFIKFVLKYAMLYIFVFIHFNIANMQYNHTPRTVILYIFIIIDSLLHRDCTPIFCKLYCRTGALYARRQQWYMMQYEEIQASFVQNNYSLRAGDTCINELRSFNILLRYRHQTITWSKWWWHDKQIWKEFVGG